MVTIQDLLSINRIDRKDIKTKYSIGHYDGVLSGIVEYEDKKYYAKCVHVDEWSGERVFYLVEPSKEQLKLIEENQELFRKYVGSHCHYDDFGRKREEYLGEKNEHTRYLKLYEENIPSNFYNDLNKLPIIGRFEGWTYSEEQEQQDKENQAS
jgi:hypothetical protein